MATREAIKVAVIYMQGLFPNYKPALVGEWNAIDALLDALGDLSEGDLMVAVRAACTPGTGRQFAPSADEIRSALTGLRAMASGVPSAGEAWAAVIGSFERMPGGNMAGGGHGSVIDHPLVREAVREMGGYGAIDYDNQMPARAHFLAIYEKLLSRNIAEVAQLPSVTEYIESKRMEINGGIKQLADHLVYHKAEGK